MRLIQITDNLITSLSSQRFSLPVTHVYNPLEYARAPYNLYLKRYGTPQKEILLIGMNPGPFGMAQTGIPFGEINSVREWLDIEGKVGVPQKMHPKRPVLGFRCTRSEVSGRRLWGWAKGRYQTPEFFFSRFFVANYCPLVFMEESGLNRTPDKLARGEKNELFAICDRALVDTVDFLSPKFVIGVGNFASSRIKIALRNHDVVIGTISHPSPANPRANTNWEGLICSELKQIGVEL